jgi:hypothetical protein
MAGLLAVKLLLLQDDAFGLLDVLQTFRPRTDADANDAANDLGYAL